MKSHEVTCVYLYRETVGVIGFNRNKYSVSN